MTFRCERCNTISQRGQKAHRVVTERRDHQYPFRPKANRDGADDPGGKGTQIVSERTVCAACVVS